MSQVSKKTILVLKPKYVTPAGVNVIAVTPFRGRKAGGNVVTITGHNFDLPTAFFGSLPCSHISDVTSTSFRCTTPPGSNLVDVTVVSNGSNKTVHDAFWYMDV